MVDVTTKGDVPCATLDINLVPVIVPSTKTGLSECHELPSQYHLAPPTSLYNPAPDILNLTQLSTTILPPTFIVPDEVKLGTIKPPVIVSPDFLT